MTILVIKDSVLTKVDTKLANCFVSTFQMFTIFKTVTMKHHLFKTLFWSVCAFTQISCSFPSNNKESDSDIGFDNYKSVTFKIDPEITDSPLETNQYIVDSIRTLESPNGLSSFDEEKFFVNNERIYIMDSDVEKSILVFDLSGNYLYKLGERGRAKNEYLYGPTDFFVAMDGEVHVFDMDGRRILRFNNCGEFIERKETPIMNSFGLTSNNKYLYCLDNMNMPDEEPDPSLLIYDFKSESKKTLIPSKRFTYHYHPRYRTFFYNDARLYHIPILSDSILVFKDDIIESVVRFDFACGFLSMEKPECVRDNPDGSRPNVSRRGYKGVEAIYEYQESESYIYMRYIYKEYLKRWFYNKRTKQIIHGNKLFAGLSVFNDYFLKGNQIIAYVGKENVEMLKEYCESEEFDKEEYKKTPSFVKAFQSGKLSAPALVYITIK